MSLEVRWKLISNRKFCFCWTYKCLQRLRVDALFHAFWNCKSQKQTLTDVIHVLKRKVFLNMLLNLQENTRVGVSFLRKKDSCNFTKKDSLTQVFSCEFYKFLRVLFFMENIRRLSQPTFARIADKTLTSKSQYNTNAQKMKFSSVNLNKSAVKLQIFSQLLTKSLMQNFLVCAVYHL